MQNAVFSEHETKMHIYSEKYNKIPYKFVEYVRTVLLQKWNINEKSS